MGDERHKVRQVLAESALHRHKHPVNHVQATNEYLLGRLEHVEDQLGYVVHKAHLQVLKGNHVQEGLDSAAVVADEHLDFFFAREGSELLLRAEELGQEVQDSDEVVLEVR